MDAYLGPYDHPYYFTIPYQTTFVRGTFPEHHHPFEQTRHKLGSALHHFASPGTGNPVLTPRADIRETVENFFIDVELPGVEQKDVSLKWTSLNTVLLEAVISRPGIAGVEEAKAGEEEKEGKSVVHLTARERHLGQHVRAFYFPVEVDRDAMTAKLRFGLLRMTVPKKPHEQVEHKEAKVEHAEE